MKKWKILFDILMEFLVFFGVSILLMIGIPKLLGFFWPFVASWILALLATPLCIFLEKHIRLRKSWASAIIIVVVLVGIAGLAYLIISKLGRELFSLLSDAPLYYSYFQHAIKELGTNLNNIIAPISPDFGNQIQSAFNDLLSQAGTAINDFTPQGVEMMGSAAANLTNGLIGTLVMILSAYFFIVDKEKLSVWFHKLLPADVEETFNNIKNKLMAALGGFMIAQFKIMAIIFIILLCGFLLLRIPYALLLALLIAFLDLLPILGTGTVLIPWTLIDLLRGDYKQGIFLIILYVVCLVSRQLLQPKIIGDSIGMDTLPTLVLIYAGYKIHGMKGVILALFVGIIFMTLFKIGIFDKKIQRMNGLIHEYRHCEEEYIEDGKRGK